MLGQQAEKQKSRIITAFESNGPDGPARRDGLIIICRDGRIPPQEHLWRNLRPSRHKVSGRDTLTTLLPENA